MGANPVTAGAVLRCTFGAAPFPLSVTQVPTVSMGGMKVATFQDNKPFVFGTCMSPSCPTMAAYGVPGPCLGAALVTAPWMNPSMTVKAGGKPVITKNSQLMCSWGGVISMQAPIAVTVNVG